MYLCNTLDDNNNQTYLYFIHPDDSNYHHPSCNQSCIVTGGTFYDLSSTFTCDYSDGFVQTLTVADSDYPSITFEFPSQSRSYFHLVLNISAHRGPLVQQQQLLNTMMTLNLRIS